MHEIAFENKVFSGFLQKYSELVNEQEIIDSEEEDC